MQQSLVISTFFQTSQSTEHHQATAGSRSAVSDHWSVQISHWSKEGRMECVIVSCFKKISFCLNTNNVNEWEKTDEFSRYISLGSSAAAPASAATEASTAESGFRTHYVLICGVLTLLGWISLSVRLQSSLIVTCYLFRLILEGHSFHYVAVHIRCVQLGGESGFELNCFPLPKLTEHIGNLLFPGTIMRFCCKVHAAVSLQVSKMRVYSHPLKC